MRDHETAMRVYVELAVISDQKKQTQVRDRFLLLAGVEACRAGWPEVAAKCHEKLISSNPAHLAHRFPTMADALRDQEFQQLVIHWERYCPFEKAEAMLQQSPSQQPRPTNEPIGSQMLTLLNK